MAAQLFGAATAAAAATSGAVAGATRAMAPTTAMSLLS